MTDVKDLDRVLRINEEQKLKNSVLEKELKIRNARANSQIEKMAELEELKDFEIEETDYAVQTQNMRAAIVARENAITFPYPEMDTHIRLGPGSLAMFFASTGSGKSTYVANAAYYLAFRENKKVLIIVNEESIIDVGARISCLHRGYSIHKFRRGTQAYPQSILDEISDLNFLKEKITILDASKHEARVRSFEGVMQAIEKAKFTYDAIFIDYYQNIDRSLADPLMNSFEAQARFASRVDIAKNSAKCPIILMGQIRKTDDDFEQRIKGRKIIVDKCTDVFELVVEKEKSRTTMKIHKDRWGGKQGEEVYLGYEDGFLKFYNDDFEERALERQRQHIDAKFSNNAPSNEEDEDD